MTLEQKARQSIDALLGESGGVVQGYKQFNPTAARGIVLREVPLKSGTCDYLLLVDRKAVGVAEAKKKGTLAEQIRIAAEVERRLSVAEELESVVSANLQRAARLRQSILQKAFTGEL